MNVKMVFEVPIFVLESGSYNGFAEDLNVSIEMIKKMKVGDEIKNDETFGCGRSCRSESIQKVFENNTGCAVLRTKWGTTDEDDPSDWEEQNIIWVKYL